ncbi:MAG: hypothetical protein COV75_07345 [Candidatus Omnitrophica bacterium CG11_big_fil_rev_8_21_14_0_20_63_9]|nr:MAG: hypothetical protein COV75_07345 [Candidatus Omnitrophica bacterium CG11_big_fil_rev_8_21_14_0_20_63_9]
MLVGAQDDDLFGSAPTETTVVLARRDGSLMTPLGLAAGEVLIEIEWSGAATLRQLIRKLDRPVYLVMMAVGVLIRQGLVRATQRELEVLVEPILEWVRVPRVNAMASQA